MCNTCTFITKYFLYSSDPQRLELDRRRLEAAHIKYACLQVVNTYPTAFKNFEFKDDIMDTLNQVTPVFFQCFEARYAG